MQGTAVDISEDGQTLGEWCDVSKVRKVYKLGDDGSGSKQKGKSEVNGHVEVDEKKEMESVILGIMSVKGT